MCRGCPTLSKRNLRPRPKKGKVREVDVVKARLAITALIITRDEVVAVEEVKMVVLVVVVLDLHRMLPP